MTNESHPASSSPNGPEIISFHHINYTVGGSEKLLNCCSKFPTIPLCKSQEEKQVLFNVSGSFMHGTNAILGNPPFLS